MVGDEQAAEHRLVMVEAVEEVRVLEVALVEEGIMWMNHHLIQYLLFPIKAG